MSETLLQRVRRVLSRVEFRDWRFVAEPFGDITCSIVGIQAQFPRPDRETGEIDWGQSRWEVILPDAADDSILKTAWVIILLTTQHECMEFFKVDSVRIFDPHTPVSSLIIMHKAEERFIRLEKEAEQTEGEGE